MEFPKHKGHVLVYGGLGALGSGCVSQFKSESWFVISVEVLKPLSGSEENATVVIVNRDKGSVNQAVNNDADINILINTSRNLHEQQADLFEAVGNLLGDVCLEAIVCVAGGYAPGNANNDFIENCEKMWLQNVGPSLLATKLAQKHLKPGGMLCLTGARTALSPTPHSIGYGFSKAAVHQMARSLGHPSSGLPKDTLTVCLLPVTLDTVMNRQMMPTADISAWTPTKYITELVMKWAKGEDRPANGSLVQFVTQNFNTDINII